MTVTRKQRDEEEFSLTRPNSALAETEKPSLQDLALARNLDEASQVSKIDLLPGEIRVWKRTFFAEKPEAIDWGFRQYFRTGSTFQPKPQDIAKLIREHRESPYFSGWDEDIRPKVSRQVADENWQRAQASRGAYFKSPEYAAFLERMKKEHGI